MKDNERFQIIKMDKEITQVNFYGDIDETKFKDFLQHMTKIQELNKQRKIFRTIKELYPASLSDVQSVIRDIPSNTLKRIMDKYVNEGYCFILPLNDEDVRFKIEGLKNARGLTPTIFYKLNLCKTIFDLNIKQYVQIADFIKDIDNTVLKDIVSREEWLMEKKKEGIQSNKPDWKKVLDFVEKEIIRNDKTYYQNFNYDYIDGWYKERLNKFPNKKEKEYFYKKLFDYGMIYRPYDNTIIYLKHPLFIPKKEDLDINNYQTFISKKEDLDINVDSFISKKEDLEINFNDDKQNSDDNKKILPFITKDGVGGNKHKNLTDEEKKIFGL